MLIYFSFEYCYVSITYVCNSISSIPFYLVLQAPETKFHLCKWISEQYIKILNWEMTQRKYFYHIHRINNLIKSAAPALPPLPSELSALSAFSRTVPRLPLPPSGRALCFSPSLPFTWHSNFHKCLCISPTTKRFLNDSFKNKEHSPYISYESFLMIMLYNKNPFCLYQKCLFLLLNRPHCYLIVSTNKFR